ncbi:MAG: M6 family metalloprotease domain-containing protein, partial [Candidatus Eisenbacteria bacterium]|nr:M6 family metalloprotease domain-containing protein [Candidatus Eisenbacteria bacterium]
MRCSGWVLGCAVCLLAFAVVQADSHTEAVGSIPSFMPLDPDIIDRMKERGEEIPISRTEARFASQGGRSVNALSRTPDKLTETVKAIVILIEFTDNPPGGPTIRYSPTVFDDMLFGTTYVRGGADPTTDRTLKNFYNEISYGEVDIITLNLPSSVGWVTAPNSYTYYCDNDGTHDNGFGPYPRNVQRLVMEAVMAADPYVDFSQYASGGKVQNLFIVHSGSGAEWNGYETLIWSHAWSIDTNDGWGTTPPDLYVDGVQITNYSMEPECGGNTTGEGGSTSGPWLPAVGVYAHEFGHVLGLPDEYDYGSQSSGTGRYSLMAGGSWNRSPNISECSGNSPAHPSAWGIMQLGFATPVEVLGCLPDTDIPPIETTGSDAIFKLINPSSSGQEYWLVENRQQIGFDEGLIRISPNAHGVLIYHVDEDVMDRNYWRPNEAECVSGGTYRGEDNCDCSSLPPNPSNGEKWYGISIEQADGSYDLELGNNSGDSQDFYNSITGYAAFNESTIPNCTSYDDCGTYISVENISGSTGTMSADFYGPADCLAAPSTLDFGTVAVGGFADDSFTITNTALGTLAGTVSETCSDFNVISGGGSYSLNAGQSVTVTVRFAPTSSGPHSCAIETGSPCCGDVSCSGVGEDPPLCSVDTEEIDFGFMFIGENADAPFTITNTGGGTLTGTVSASDPNYSIVSGGGPYSLGAGQSVVVTVRFEPVIPGDNNCMIETGTDCENVSCVGMSDYPAACSVSPTNLDFGEVDIGSTLYKTFTITNIGGSTLTGTVSESCDHYSITGGGGSYSLGADESKLVTVRYAPASAGIHQCTIETGTDCADVSCTGDGDYAPDCDVNPTSLDFGEVML